jgi:hypothetical protein
LFDGRVQANFLIFLVCIGLEIDWHLSDTVFASEDVLRLDGGFQGRFCAGGIFLIVSKNPASVKYLDSTLGGTIRGSDAGNNDVTLG